MGDKKKIGRKHVIIAVIILLLLILIKLYFEFRGERERLDALRRQKAAVSQNADMLSYIDSLCRIYTEACDEFENFANMGSLMVYSEELRKRRELLSLIDSLCLADSVNCDLYKRFTDLDELRRFLAGMNGDLSGQSYREALQRQLELLSLIDSLCLADSANCDFYKSFSDLDALRRFLEGRDGKDGLNGSGIGDGDLLRRQELLSLIDSLCRADSANCDFYKSFSDLDALRRFLEGKDGRDGLNGSGSGTGDGDLLRRQELLSLIDSLCRADSANCEMYKRFSDLDELRRFLEEMRRLREQEIANSLRMLREQEIADSLRRLREQEIADSLRRLREQEIADSLRMLREQEIADSLARERLREDSIAKAGEKACKDTVAPWVYPDPTGGVYFEPIRVSFVASKENCSIFYKRSLEADYRLYEGEEILISQHGELYYYAVDTCGNLFEEQKKIYDFRQKQPEDICPPGMVLVESSQGNFCIDQYAWENKKGLRPRNNISWQDARDSCQSIGKRLCTAQEWTSACKGPYNWRYPYGDKYIRRACITQDSTFQRNGWAGECRGWYAIYDMAGNLAEWTSTRAPENNRFFIVKGGFWSSGNVADCDMTRYSYYPQNQHNQIGFRCCADAKE